MDLMADLGGVFDATTIEPAGDRTPLPAGEYRATAIKSDWKATKSGSGKYAEITWQVLDGSHKGRMLWTRLNLDNPSATAVEIAMKELAAICKAAGVEKIRDTIELHDIPVIITVAIENRPDTGAASNVVKGYKSVKVANEQRQAVAASSGSESKPSWM
jgi:hypothetical protein